MERAKTVFANLLVIILVSFLMIWAATWYRQWRQFTRGEQALAAGNPVAAIASFEAAIHMYTPLSPFVEQSAERLWVLAEGAERLGNTETALIAYRSLRSSFYAVRGLTGPGTEWIARCDQKIARLAPATQPR